MSKIPENLVYAAGAARDFARLVEDGETGLSTWWAGLQQTAERLRKALDEAVPTPQSAEREQPAAPQEEVVMLDGIVQIDARHRPPYRGAPVITNANGLYVGHRIVATFAVPLPTRLLIPALPVMNLEAQS